MALRLDDKLVVGISSRALFDLEEENKIYEEEGLKAYSEYQLSHENDILKPGTAFPLIKALHKKKHRWEIPYRNNCYVKKQCRYKLAYF